MLHKTSLFSSGAFLGAPTRAFLRFSFVNRAPVGTPPERERGIMGTRESEMSPLPGLAEAVPLKGQRCDSPTGVSPPPPSPCLLKNAFPSAPCVLGKFKPSN